jgi:hypothetical protein
MADQLRAKMASIEQTARATFSNSDIEPQLLDLLVYLRANAQSREVLETVLIEGLDSAPESIIQMLGFTMHELRWSGIYDALEREEAATTKFGPTRSLERMLSAYEDDWDEAYTYDYYRQNFQPDAARKAQQICQANWNCRTNQIFGALEIYGESGAEDVPLIIELRVALKAIDGLETSWHDVDVRLGGRRHEFPLLARIDPYGDLTYAGPRLLTSPVRSAPFSRILAARRFR